MAIYHFSGTIISRSQGRSAVAAIAYRSGEKLYDERYGVEHDYTKKTDVAHSEILLTENAPEWMLDRSKLWNAVEANEKRKDAQLAREFNFALPRELTIDQNIVLAREFVKSNFSDQGMIADLCIHNEKQKDGEYQPHAHVMLTMREVTESGFGKKVREWNDKELLMVWREAWAELANHHLALNGHDIRIDHRTLEAQGISLEPQSKIGPSVSQTKMARLEDHQRIARENGEKIFSDPAIALKAITNQQSTFTHQDTARFINRHTVDEKQFSLVFEKVKSHESIVALGLDDKNRERFTTREMLNLERTMMDHSVALSESETHKVSQVNQHTALSEKSLTEEQGIAFDHLMKPDDLKCVVGFAGTGKSYLLGAAKNAWELEGYSVHGVTLSGIAAENLEGSSGIESRTLSSRQYFWDKGEQQLTRKDILVVDEAGMLSSPQMASVMEKASEGGAKVVLVGDPEQLQAIGAGAAFRAITERMSYVELSDIRRQLSDWQKEATKEFATQKTAEAIARYDRHNHVHAFDTKDAAKTALVQLWNDARITDPSKTQIMLAYNRDDVLQLNQMARSMRQSQQELGQEALFKTDRGERTFAEKDRIYFLKNDRLLGVMNGSLGTIQSIKGDAITVLLDRNDCVNQKNRSDNKLITMTMDRYNYLDYGYAATVHKAQGVTVDRSYVLASKYLDSHSSYVAMSRHRESADLFYSKDVFRNKDDLVKTLSRERHKDVTLDYLDVRDKQSELTVSKETNTMQDKLRAFTESALATREAMKSSHEKQSSRLNSDIGISKIATQRTSLEAFKKQFEHHNPDLAAELRDSIMPVNEKAAKAYMAEFDRLKEMVDKKDRTSHLAKTHLEKLADKMASQKKVMHYVRKSDASMEKQVQEISKEFKRERDLELER